MEIGVELTAAIERVLSSGRYLLGTELQSFEEEFAEYIGCDHCVGVANGLDALTLALRAMDVGPGDEVVVPSNTYIATWLAVSQVGATPVPVEPDPATYNLDPDRVVQVLSSRTKVLLPVHLYGHPADMDPLMELSERHGFAVLEDAAQGHGGSYKGRPMGSIGDASAWSFYPAKNLGCLGDGGAVTTNNPQTARRLRLLRNYGSSVKYVHEIRGVNSRLDELQAAVLRVKLRHLDEWNRRRKEVADCYLLGLKDAPLSLPTPQSWAMPAWHLFVVRSKRRDVIQQALREALIETLIHYPIPPHLQAAYRDLGMMQGTFPITEAIHREVLSLPIGPHLETEKVRRVIEVLNAVAG